jgi:hypothetical protein
MFLVFLAVAALIVGIGTWRARQDVLPATFEVGEVVRFGTTQGRWGDSVPVVVRANGGALYTLPIPASLLSNCRVGSRIRLLRQGQLLRVRNLGCAPPA